MKEIKPDASEVFEATDSPHVHLFPAARRGSMRAEYFALTSCTPSQMQPCERPLLKAGIAQVFGGDDLLALQRPRATNTIKSAKPDEQPLPPNSARFQNPSLSVLYRPGPFEKPYG